MIGDALGWCAVCVSAVVVGVTLCCRPAWWATPQFWVPWHRWFTMDTASSTASETTGGQTEGSLCSALMFHLTAVVNFLPCETACSVISNLHFDLQDCDFRISLEVLPSDGRRDPVQLLQQLPARDAAPSNNIAALGGSLSNNTSD